MLAQTTQYCFRSGSGLQGISTYQTTCSVNNPEIRGVPLCGKFGNGWGLAPADTYFPQRKRPWLLCLPPVNNSMDCNGLQVRADRNATLDYRAVRSMLQH